MKTNDLYIAKEIDPDNLPEGEVIAVSIEEQFLKGKIKIVLGEIVCIGKFGSMSDITHYLAPVTLAELKIMKEEGE